MQATSSNFVADSGVEQREREVTTFELEELALEPETATVADELSVRADATMTGDPDGDPVVAVGSRHGAHGFWLPDRLRQMLV